MIARSPQAVAHRAALKVGNWPGLHAAGDSLYAAQIERQLVVVDVRFATVRTDPEPT
jgi:hypothetical protein